MTSSRRLGREQALQALYSVTIGRREPGEALAEVVDEPAEAEHRAFVEDLVLGTLEFGERGRSYR